MTIPQFLTPNTVYGVHLVFKFCESSTFSATPTYLNLKYRNGSETLHAYFATWRDDDWMMIELCRFLYHIEDDITFKFLLESFSPHSSKDGAIYVEGIEFRAIDKVKHENSEKPEQVQKVQTNDEEILNGYINYEDDEKLFLASEVNEKKQLMLPAKAILCDVSDVKLFTSKASANSRFPEVIELLPQQIFHINCRIESHMLSQDTEYVCYLVFKISEESHGLQCPVKVRDLLHPENKKAEFIYFISPSPWNLHDITRVPEQREDGWMEVSVGRFNSTRDLQGDCALVNLKFTSYEGPMSGVILCGLEFRPM
uniref:F-box protein At2g02240-like n=1 Tax=Erigeron canadensis TaxID=72917 RepID=UPI001CB9C422|nr:F-box protein At2g02240-like [Erigeron canadensis]